MMMRERLPDRREAETFEITHRTYDGVEQTFIAGGATRATAWENIHNGAIRRVEPNDPENYIALGPITSPASGERDASMWATVVADDYDGSLRWDCRTAGDMGDGDSLPTIALAADTFPEGTKLVITEPALRMEGK